jgi:hypothetical protein
MKLRWTFGIIAGAVLAIFMLYPQARLMYLRGHQWQGNYAITDVDEVAYAAYLQSLIDGKPRKNDPYAKLEDTSETPQSESLFSVQFAASYAVALPARMLGISAPLALTILGVWAAFSTTLVLFWLIGMFTNDSLYAMVGCLVIFCFGTLAGGEGAMLGALELSVAGPFFPGFRRYIPAVTIPVFFAFFGVLWLLVNSRDVKKRLIFGLLAFISFGFSLFSYFYLWTTLAAWLIGVIGLWSVIRPTGWRKNLKDMLMLGVGCFLWLIPYGILLSGRSQTMDDVQLLEFTHAPDFARVPIYLGILVFIILGFGIRAGKIALKEPLTLFCAGFALVPIAVHNQQIITGRSLQPVHYDLFTANYLVVLALILAIRQFFKGTRRFEIFQTRMAVSTVGLSAIAWGIVECHFTTCAYDGINIERDQGFEIMQRLREAQAKNNSSGTILSFPIWLSDDLPTNAPQPVLTAFHQIVFNGFSRKESKERYYQYLYYQNTSPEQLALELKAGNFSPIIALFGWGRYSNRLSFKFTPLTESEIAEEAAHFNEYIANFNPHYSPKTILSFVIVANRTQTDLSNVDKWYERSEEMKNTVFTLYKVKLKAID